VVPGGEGERGAGHHDVGPQPVHPVGEADPGDPVDLPVRQPDAGQDRAGGGDPLGEPLIGHHPAGGEGIRVSLIGEPTAYHLGPRARLGRRGDLDHQPEPVDQLRARLALLRVHRADQEEPRRVLDRDTVPLDVRPPHRGGVQQQIDQMIGKQVHLVDVEHAPMRRGEQPRFVRLRPVAQCPLDVKGADHPVLGGTDRQFDQGRATAPGRRRRIVRTVRAGRVRRGRVAGESAAADGVHIGQQRGERPHDGRLGGALLATHEHPADAGVYRVEEQRQPQVGQADHGGERVRRHRSRQRRVIPISLPRVSTPACRWTANGRSLLAPGSTPCPGLPAAVRRWPHLRRGSPVTVAGPPRTRTGFLRAPFVAAMVAHRPRWRQCGAGPAHAHCPCRWLTVGCGRHGVREAGEIPAWSSPL